MRHVCELRFTVAPGALEDDGLSFDMVDVNTGDL